MKISLLFAVLISILVSSCGRTYGSIEISPDSLLFTTWTTSDGYYLNLSSGSYNSPIWMDYNGCKYSYTFYGNNYSGNYQLNLEGSSENNYICSSNYIYPASGTYTSNSSSLTFYPSGQGSYYTYYR